MDSKKKQRGNSEKEEDVVATKYQAMNRDKNTGELIQIIKDRDN